MNYLEAKEILNDYKLYEDGWYFQTGLKPKTEAIELAEALLESGKQLGWNEYDINIIPGGGEIEVSFVTERRETSVLIYPTLIMDFDVNTTIGLEFAEIHIALARVEELLGLWADKLGVNK